MDETSAHYSKNVPKPILFSDIFLRIVLLFLAELGKMNLLIKFCQA